MKLITAQINPREIQPPNPEDEHQQNEIKRQEALKQKKESWRYSQMHDLKPTIQSSSKSVWSTVGDPVDVGTGAFCLEEVDLQVAGAVPITLKRSYSSKAPVMGSFGFGWRHNFPANLVINEQQGASIIYASEPDGSIVAYSKKEGETMWKVDFDLNPELEMDPQNSVKMRWCNAYIEYVDIDGRMRYAHHAADGSVRIYNMRQFVVQDQPLDRPYLDSISDPYGRSLWFVYDEQSSIEGNANSQYGRIIKIHNDFGESIALSYTDMGLIREAKASDGRIVKYEYDAHGDLIRVHFPDENAVEYSYEHEGDSSKHTLLQERKPQNRVLENIYDAQGRVLQQKVRARCSQEVEHHAYFEYRSGGDLAESKTVSRVSDPYGRVTEYRFYKGRLYKIIDPLGQVIERTWYIDATTVFDPVTEVLQATDTPGHPLFLKESKSKRGLHTVYFYDENGNPIKTVVWGGDLTGTGVKEIITRYEYEKAFPYRLLKEIFSNTNGQGHRSEYAYADTAQINPIEVKSFVNDVPIKRTYLVYGSDKHNKGKVISESTYDGHGALLRQIENEYDESGRLKATHQLIDNTGAKYTIQYKFNNAGFCEEQMYPSGDRITYEYDILHRKISQRHFDVSGQKLDEQIYKYNKNGELE